MLGPHGPARRNTRGSNLLSFYLSHEVRIENTFFDAPNHTTFTNVKDSDKTMIDIFACAKSLHCQVRNCRTIAEGVESDHTAVRLDLVLTSLKRTDLTALFRGTTDWRKIATDPTTRQRYNDLLAEATADSPDMASVRMTVLSCHQFHPRHLGALHPPLRLPVAVSPGQIMTLRWLVKA